MKQSSNNLSVSLSLIDMGLQTCQYFDNTLEFTCLIVLIIQACISLWWGVLFVCLLSEVSETICIILLVLLLFVLYFISQFFQSFLNAVISSSLLWIFLRDSNYTYQTSDNLDRVLLYIKTTLTSCIGSICKAALLVSPCQYILQMNAKLLDMTKPHWRSPSTWIYIPAHIVKLIVGYCEHFAEKHHRLSLSHVATYGHTLCKSAQEQKDINPDIIDLMLIDTTGFHLYMLSTALSCIITIILSLIGTIEEEDVAIMWPLFFTGCYILSYVGVSLAMRCFQSAVDAMFVGYIDCPNVFAEKNAILYLRFQRISEIDLNS
jgi:hypothetical protein